MLVPRLCLQERIAQEKYGTCFENLDGEHMAPSGCVIAAPRSICRACMHSSAACAASLQAAPDTICIWTHNAAHTCSALWMGHPCYIARHGPAQHAPSIETQSRPLQLLASTGRQRQSVAGYKGASHRWGKQAPEGREGNEGVMTEEEYQQCKGDPELVGDGLAPSC